MCDDKQQKALCQNVFKSYDKTTLKTEFNQKWIELINRMETNRNTGLCKEE